jgi:flagellin
MHVTTGTNDSASTGAAGLTFGDFNGDGVVDIAAEDVVSFNSIAAVLLANTSQLCSIARLDLTTQSSARSALSTLDSIMTRVSKELGNIGATQSRLSSAMNTLGATRDNYSAAATRITDVDVASESADLLRHQILTQTAGAVLAQANQSPGLLLRLLQDI